VIINELRLIILEFELPKINYNLYSIYIS